MITLAIPAIIAALNFISSVAPGFLAAFSNHQSDADAIATAEKALTTIPEHPAEDGLQTQRDHLASLRKP